jgi:hypothetical protein
LIPAVDKAASDLPWVEEFVAGSALSDRHPNFERFMPVSSRRFHEAEICLSFVACIFRIASNAIAGPTKK